MAVRRGRGRGRGRTPLILPSSFPPSLALEASNQAQTTQTDNLVQQNRILELERINQNLANQLANEQKCAREMVLEMKKKEHQWQEDFKQILQSCHIYQDELKLEVLSERGNVIKEKASTREEKLERLRRDYEIKRIRMHEQDMELEIEDLKQQKVDFAQMMETKLEQERRKNARYTAKQTKEPYTNLDDALSQLRNVTYAKEQKEIEFNELHKEHVDLASKYDVMDTKLLMARLDLDRALSKVKELEWLNNELKRTNANLTKKLERSGASKEGELADERLDSENEARELDLDLQLQVLQEAVEVERKFAAMDLAKEKARVEDFMALTMKWEHGAEMKHQENTQLMKKVSDLEKICAKLKAELEVERTRTQVSPPSLQVRFALGSEQRRNGKRKGVADDDEDVEETKPDKTPNVVKKKKRTIISLESDSSNLKLTQFDGNLGIPSRLSPLREDDRVPHRSMASNALSRFKFKRS